MSAKPYKSPISYPYMEQLYIYDGINIVKLRSDASDPKKTYFVIENGKLYSAGAPTGVTDDKLATPNVNYRFTNIVYVSSASIPFYPNVNYILTGNTSSLAASFNPTTNLLPRRFAASKYEICPECRGSNPPVTNTTRLTIFLFARLLCFNCITQV